jgi:hypothetical protein
MDLLPLFQYLTSKAILVAFLNYTLQMHEENFAPNYNIFTGKAKETTPTLGEILTGSLWALARQRYCGDDPDAFPLALVGVYDKTNRDVFFHFHVHHSFVHHHS